MHSYFLYQQADTSQTKKQEKKDSVVLPQTDTFPIDLMDPKNQDILTSNSNR